VVVGAVQPDRPEHGVEDLFAVGDELGVVTRAAVDALAAMSAVGVEEPLEQRRAELGHGGSRRGLEGGQAVGPGGGIAQRGDRHFRQAGYLCVELLLELRVEPLFSAPPTVGGAWPASGETGLVSHMASLTSTISSTWAMNCLYLAISAFTFSSSAPAAS
jgi:hypothetical protein